MSEPATITVDLEGMLCAQALAVVAKAMKPLTPGTALLVRYSTEDVKQDILTWAKTRCCRITEEPPATLRLVQPENALG